MLHRRVTFNFIALPFLQQFLTAPRAELDLEPPRLLLYSRYQSPADADMVEYRLRSRAHRGLDAT
jgi:hypothetical protein